MCTHDACSMFVNISLCIIWCSYMHILCGIHLHKSWMCNCHQSPPNKMFGIHFKLRNPSVHVKYFCIVVLARLSAPMAMTTFSVWLSAGLGVYMWFSFTSIAEQTCLMKYLLTDNALTQILENVGSWITCLNYTIKHPTNYLMNDLVNELVYRSPSSSSIFISMTTQAHISVQNPISSRENCVPAYQNSLH